MQLGSRYTVSVAVCRCVRACGVGGGVVAMAGGVQHVCMASSTVLRSPYWHIYVDLHC